MAGLDGEGKFRDRISGWRPKPNGPERFMIARVASNKARVTRAAPALYIARERRLPDDVR